MAKSETFTVSTPVKVDITLNDGKVYSLKPGLNHDVPDEVANHWYAAASGCKVVDLKAPDEGKAKGGKGKDAKKAGGETPTELTLAERAKAVGLDDIADLSEDEVLKLVEEAEVKAKAAA
jgi:hypothetical protein